MGKYTGQSGEVYWTEWGSILDRVGSILDRVGKYTGQSGEVYWTEWGSILDRLEKVCLCILEGSGTIYTFSLTAQFSCPAY